MAGFPVGADASKLLQPVKNQRTDLIEQEGTEETERTTVKALLTLFPPVQNSDFFCQVTQGDPLVIGKKISPSWSFCAKFICVCPGFPV
jgi:hypothetical protein